MSLGFFLKGLLIGLSIAAPVGPIGVLCIRRTLAEGRVAGFVSGLGAATADAVYGAVAGFGLALITDTLVHQQQWLRLIGGIYLCYLGIRTFVAPPAERAAVARAGGLAGAYATTFLLTLTNPTTILSFVAIFAGLGMGGTSRSYVDASVLVLGVFFGSALWWLVLSGSVSLLRERLGIGGLRWVNRISGGVILAFGAAALVSLLQ